MLERVPFRAPHLISVHLIAMHSRLGALLGLGLLLALLTTAAVPALALKPVNGKGAYKVGTAWSATNIPTFQAFISALVECPPRTDGSWNYLTMKSQCGSYPTSISALPSLGSIDTFWDWVCFAALNDGATGDKCVAPAGTRGSDFGAGQAYYLNWVGEPANKARGESRLARSIPCGRFNCSHDTLARSPEDTFLAEIRGWSEADILSKAKKLFATITGPSKQFFIDAMHAILISEYIYSSAEINKFQWAILPAKPTAKDVAMTWRNRAVLLALRSRAPEAPGGIVYRGRELRGTLAQQTTAYTVGNVVWEKGFASSTQVKDQAYGYTRPEQPVAEIVQITASANSRGHVLGTKVTKEVLFEVRIRVGLGVKPPSNLLTHHWHRSFPLQPGTRFRVTGRKCKDNVPHKFISCKFETCASAQTYCTNVNTPQQACNATWTKVCTLSLAEVDSYSFCDPGATFIKVCLPGRVLRCCRFLPDRAKY